MEPQTDPHLRIKLEILNKSIKGEVYSDISHRIMYSTDASVFKETPLAVAVPENNCDLGKIVEFAASEQIPLIPRGAGTSLAGQVVGKGLVIDLSKHFTDILELNVEEKWVVVQPGVILNQLNNYLKSYGLFFGPETSTASRCTIGGMLGNNSCGLHSMIYRSTRDHTLGVDAILSDGSETVFRALDEEEFAEKCEANSLEGKIYRKVRDILFVEKNQEEIREGYPDRALPRRNSGYAIDVLLDSRPFTPGAKKLNLCNLLAGSEGTLALATSIKLNLVPAPPKEKAVVCAHFDTLEEALEANLIAIDHLPGAIELIDDQILKLTEGNIQQRKNRFFVKGNPGAILIIEFARDTKEEIEELAEQIADKMSAAKLGYHYPLIFGQENIGRIWALRRAGLGLMSNVPGDAKPITFIEDTAVSPKVLPQYIAELRAMLAKLGLTSVYQAHVGSGELHVRPILNVKDPLEVEKLRTVALNTVGLVKKYNGSLSGEHGDGRLRSEFVPLIVGEKNYRLLREIKETWDPDYIFNPGKIVDGPRMNNSLRYLPGQKTKEIDTLFDFSETLGMIRAVEKCNGSGDCKNTWETGNVMCPSYQATLDERRSTRGRANVMREFLGRSEPLDSFGSIEVKEVLDECLSCKACKSECPSSLDMAKLKAEFMQHYHDIHGGNLRTVLMANIHRVNTWGSLFPALFNKVVSNRFTSKMIKKALGFAEQRDIPRLFEITLEQWANKHLEDLNGKIQFPIKQVYLFNDEFTNSKDVEVGIKLILLLNRLNYRVVIPRHQESGRTFLSKGFVRKARKVANANIRLLKGVIDQEHPLIGIDPSVILCFRDEYLDLAEKDLKGFAGKLAESTFLADEFLAGAMENGCISRDAFTKETRQIKCHGHCHQKSLASTDSTQEMLSFPENYSAVEIDSGCCGMAGSFGYEREHYDLSVRIGELQLLPEIRKIPESVLIAAPGTSCRQQIKDQTNRTVKHPIEILFEALE